MSDSVATDFRTEVEIALKFPIHVDGVDYKSLTMRRPKAKDSLAAGKVVGNQDEKALRMFSRLCAVAPEVLEELDQFDMDAVSEQFNRFTARK